MTMQKTQNPHEGTRYEPRPKRTAMRCCRTSSSGFIPQEVNPDELLLTFLFFHKLVYTRCFYSRKQFVDLTFM